MGIVKAVFPKGSHVCQTPKNPEKQYGFGTVWECDECGKQAKLENNQREGWIWVWLVRKDYVPSLRWPRP
jgi:hypothetical protein